MTNLIDPCVLLGNVLDMSGEGFRFRIKYKTDPYPHISVKVISYRYHLIFPFFRRDFSFSLKILTP